MLHITPDNVPPNSRPFVLRGSISKGFDPYAAGVFSPESAAQSLTAISWNRYARYNEHNQAPSRSQSTNSLSSSSSSSSRPLSSASMKHNSNIVGLLVTRPLSASKTRKSQKQRVYVGGELDRWGYDDDGDAQSEDSLEEYVSGGKEEEKRDTRKKRPSTAPSRRSPLSTHTRPASAHTKATARVTVKSAPKRDYLNVKSGSRPLSATSVRASSGSKPRPSSAGPSLQTSQRLERVNRSRALGGNLQVRRLDSAKAKRSSNKNSTNNTGLRSSQNASLSLRELLRQPRSVSFFHPRLQGKNTSMPREFFVGSKDAGRSRFQQIENKANNSTRRHLVKVNRLAPARPKTLDMSYVMNMDAAFDAALVKEPPSGMLFDDDMHDEGEDEGKVPEHSTHTTQRRRWNDFYCNEVGQQQKSSRTNTTTAAGDWKKQLVTRI